MTPREKIVGLVREIADESISQEPDCKVIEVTLHALVEAVADLDCEHRDVEHFELGTHATCRADLVKECGL